MYPPASLHFVMVKQSDILSTQSLRAEVSRKLGRSVRERILAEVAVKNRDLQAAERPPDFKTKMVEVALYKDLHRVSYRQLSLRVKPFLPMSDRTLRHNVQRIRRRLRSWSKTVLVKPSLAVLKNRAKNQRVVKSFGKVNLWMDTSEFRLTGKSSMSAKDVEWSHKVSGPGRKWLTLHDAFGATVFLAGPFLPKEYDAHIFLRVLHRIEKHFAGATIIADNHFRSAADSCTRVDLITKISKAGRPRVIRGRRMKRELTKEQERHNKDVSAIRGRVEAPYGNWEQKFRALEGPFGEGSDQLDCALRTAAAVHRLRKGK